MFGDHEGLPPALIQTAQHDPLRDQGPVYADALRKAGVDVRLTNYVDAVHGYMSIPGRRAGGPALAEAAAFPYVAAAPARPRAAFQILSSPDAWRAPRINGAQDSGVRLGLGTGLWPRHGVGRSSILEHGMSMDCGPRAAPQNSEQLSGPTYSMTSTPTAPSTTPQVAINDIGTAEDFLAAIDSTIKYFNDGDIVEGTIVKVDRDEVLLDIGYKTEGVIPSRELSIKHDVDPNEVVTVGDEIEALVLQKEDKEGRLILSKKRAQYERAWGTIEEKKEQATRSSRAPSSRSSRAA